MVKNLFTVLGILFFSVSVLAQRTGKEPVGKKQKSAQKKISKSSRVTKKPGSVRKAKGSGVGKLAMAKKKTTVKKKVGYTNKKKVSYRGSKQVAKTFTLRGYKKKAIAPTPMKKIALDNFEVNRGNLPWPVDNADIKLGFGRYTVPGTPVWHTNPGLTLETDAGMPVKAVFDGDVYSVFDVDGNTAVIISHGKYLTSYSNLDGVQLEKGEKIKAGQVLGKAATNNSGNGEIEFVVTESQGMKNSNPETWIRKK